jgi:hypothetical protein
LKRNVDSLELILRTLAEEQVFSKSIRMPNFDEFPIRSFDFGRGSGSVQT